MAVLRTVRGLLAWLAITALQFAILIALAVLGFGLADTVLAGSSESVRSNASTAAALLVPIVVGLSGEWLLKGTRLDWLRLSQNPVFLLPP